MKNRFRLVLFFILFSSFSFFNNQSRSSNKIFNNKFNKLSCLVNIAYSGENLGSTTEEFEGLKQINGTEIFCKVTGKGEPLVIVHGGPGLAHDYLFEPFKQLADKYKLIFYDQRGCGRSAEFNAKDSVTINDMVDDLEGIRQAFKIEKMNLIGQSWGAIISINYLIKYADNAKKLLLLEPGFGSTEYIKDFQNTLMERLSQHDKEKLVQLSQNPALKSDPILFKEFMNIRYKAYSRDSLFLQKMHTDYFDSLRVKKFFASSAAFSPYLMNFNIYQEMQNINCPTLVIHGEFDPIPTVSIERMAAAIPRSELHVIKDCGHFVHIEKPEVYFGLIRAFLNKN